MSALAPSAVAPILHYNLASSTLAGVMQKKVDKVLEGGRARASVVLDYVRENVPADTVAPAARISWAAPNADTSAPLAADQVPALLDHVLDQAEAARAAAPRSGLIVTIGDSVLPVHRHAALQAAERGGIPRGFAGELFDGNPGRRDLLALALGRLLGEQPGKRFLLRKVKGQLLSFLSDSYRRLDSRPILNSYAEACAELGLVPYDGSVSDTRWSIRALLPYIFEPIPGEAMVYGFGLSSSDHGDGTLQAWDYSERAACCNGMTHEAALRVVHLGKKLSDDFAFSQRTYDLDTRASASAVADVVRARMAPPAIERRQAEIRAAHEARIERASVPGRLRAAGLGKAEIENATKVFEVGAVEVVPPGDTMWRLSNAVSWLAHETESQTRKDELQAVAGDLVASVAPKLATR